MYPNGNKANFRVKVEVYYIAEKDQSTLSDTMISVVSLKTLPNVNICDPSHDKNLLEIMSETELINQNIFKLLLILISTTKKHCNNTVKAKSFDVIDLLARF